MVIEATSRTAFKKGDWVMIPPYEGPALNDKVQIELGNNINFQLYNLAEDVGQQNNLSALNPEKLEEMLRSFEAVRGEDYGKIEKLELKQVRKLSPIFPRESNKITKWNLFTIDY